LSGVHISTGWNGGRGVLELGDNEPPGWGLKYEVIRACLGSGAKELGGSLRRGLGRMVVDTGRLLLAIGATGDTSGKLFGGGGSGGTQTGTSGGAAGGVGVWAGLLRSRGTKGAVRAGRGVVAAGSSVARSVGGAGSGGLAAR